MERSLFCVTFELLFALVHTRKDLKIRNDTQYDFLTGIGGPVRVLGFYEKNETRQFVSKLGEWCKWSDNCFAAYATCNKGRCACSPGFLENNGVCQPKTVQCPNPSGGDTNLLITSPMLCHIKHVGANIEHVGCSPDKEFCFTHPITRTSARDFYLAGHCCPMLTPATKLTSPVCPVILQNDVFKDGNKNCEQCIPTMEQCVSFKIWNTEMSYTYVGRCCPMPCRDAVHSNQKLINVDGHCFYHRKHVKINCDYAGNTIQHLDGPNSYECEYECLRNIQCTHFAWSRIGCFLKHTQTTQQILQSLQASNGAICGYIEGRTW